MYWFSVEKFAPHLNQEVLTYTKHTNHFDIAMRRALTPTPGLLSHEAGDQECWAYMWVNRAGKMIHPTHFCVITWPSEMASKEEIAA